MESTTGNGNTIHRFKALRHDFSEKCKKTLDQFAIMNQNLPRKEFQAEWMKWTNTHEKLFEKESDVLKKNGFEGDIMDKMYKSVRYYHRKKINKKKKKEINQEQEQHNPTKKYIRLTDILHNQMNNHITTYMNKHLKNTNTNANTNPQEQELISITHVQSFHDFLENNREMIVGELVKIKHTKGSLVENMGNKLQRNYRDKFYKQRLNIMNNIHL